MYSRMYENLHAPLGDSNMMLSKDAFPSETTIPWLQLFIGGMYICIYIKKYQYEACSKFFHVEDVIFAKNKTVKRKSSNLFQASDPLSHFILWQPHLYKHLRSALRCWSLLTFIGQFRPTSPQFRPPGPSFQGKAFFRQALAELLPNFSRDCSLHTQSLTQRKRLSWTFCSTLICHSRNRTVLNILKDSYNYSYFQDSEALVLTMTCPIDVLDSLWDFCREAHVFAALTDNRARFCKTLLPETSSDASADPAFGSSDSREGSFVDKGQAKCRMRDSASVGNVSIQ